MAYEIGNETSESPSVVLFGYASSPFTNKIRLALRIKQIPFSYVTVPSMMPRPLLQETFGISYRKIPILAIGREVYCDTSVIIEALEHYFPSPSYGTVYPPVPSSPAWSYRPLARGFASFWTDKPLFRTTTGLIPHTVWETAFGADRAQLIGHKLDPKKLKAKVPQNLAVFDMHLSLLEPLFSDSGMFNKWVFPTETPSLADLSLYYQIRWGVDIAAGKGVYSLTGGGTEDTNANITASVWNEKRYPGLWRWFHAFESYIASLPDLETSVREGDISWKKQMKATQLLDEYRTLAPAAAASHRVLDRQCGLVLGAMVSVTPDDIGRANPTIGKLVALGVEEIVIEPKQAGEISVRAHFPRLGFVVKLVGSEQAKL